MCVNTMPRLSINKPWHSLFPSICHNIFPIDAHFTDGVTHATPPLWADTTCGLLLTTKTAVTYSSLTWPDINKCHTCLCDWPRGPLILSRILERSTDTLLFGWGRGGLNWGKKKRKKCTCNCHHVYFSKLIFIKRTTTAPSHGQLLIITNCSDKLLVLISEYSYSR